MSGNIEIYCPLDPVYQACTLSSNPIAMAAGIAGMLQQGDYLAPASYEAGFMSAAHTDEDVDKTIEAARAVMKTL